MSEKNYVKLIAEYGHINMRIGNKLLSCPVEMTPQQDQVFRFELANETIELERTLRRLRAALRADA